MKVSGAKKYSLTIAGEKTFEIIAGNSMYANIYYKKSMFDIIAGDLPYGVRHGNVTGRKQGAPTRNPSELLESCLPAWVDVLKPGGAVALAWNVNVLPRAQIERIFEQHGLTVKKEGAYSGIEHRVDQAIIRDIIVGVKERAHGSVR
jgi:tRNA G10  N-methylase Trm11